MGSWGDDGGTGRLFCPVLTKRTKIKRKEAELRRGGSLETAGKLG